MTEGPRIDVIKVESLPLVSSDMLASEHSYLP